MEEATTAVPAVQRLCQRIVASPWFLRCVAVCILTAAALNGAETHPPIAGQNDGKAWIVVDYCITVGFAVELAIRLLAVMNKPWLLFCNSLQPLDVRWWDCADICFIILTFLQYQEAAVFRLLRIFRIVRFFTIFPALQSIITGVLASLLSIGYLFVFILVYLYMFAVVGMMTFGDDDEKHFGTMLDSFMTLFTIATSRSWTSIMFPLVFSCSGGKVYPECTERNSSSVLKIIFFVVFVLSSGVILLNVLISIVMYSLRLVRKKLLVRWHLRRKWQQQRKIALGGGGGSGREGRKNIEMVEMFGKPGKGRGGRGDENGDSDEDEDLNNTLDTSDNRPRHDDSDLPHQSPPTLGAKRMAARQQKKGVFAKAQTFVEQVAGISDPFIAGSEDGTWEKPENALDKNDSNNTNNNRAAFSSPSSYSSSSSRLESRVHSLHRDQSKVLGSLSLLSNSLRTTDMIIRGLMSFRSTLVTDAARYLRSSSSHSAKQRDVEVFRMMPALAMAVEELRHEAGGKSQIGIAAVHSDGGQFYWEIVKKIAAIVDSKTFEGFILLLILATAILLGFQTSKQYQTSATDILDTILSSIFAAEMGLKMLSFGLRPWAIFFPSIRPLSIDYQNVFDTAVIILSFFFPSLLVFRLVRLLPVLPYLASYSPLLPFLSHHLLASLASMAAGGMAFLMSLYVFGVAGVALFRDNDPLRFGDLGLSIISLLQCATGDDWENVLFVNVRGCGHYPILTIDLACSSTAWLPPPGVSVLYFLMFMIVSALITAHVVLGMIYVGDDSNGCAANVLDGSSSGILGDSFLVSPISRAQIEASFVSDPNLARRIDQLCLELPFVLRECNDAIISVLSQHQLANFPDWTSLSPTGLSLLDDHEDSHHPVASLKSYLLMQSEAKSRGGGRGRDRVSSSLVGSTTMMATSSVAATTTINIAPTELTGRTIGSRFFGEAATGAGTGAAPITHSSSPQSSGRNNNNDVPASLSSSSNTPEMQAAKDFVRAMKNASISGPLGFADPAIQEALRFVAHFCQTRIANSNSSGDSEGLAIAGGGVGGVGGASSYNSIIAAAAAAAKNSSSSSSKIDSGGGVVGDVLSPSGGKKIAREGRGFMEESGSSSSKKAVPSQALVPAPSSPSMTTIHEASLILSPAGEERVGKLTSHPHAPGMAMALHPATPKLWSGGDDLDADEILALDKASYMDLPITKSKIAGGDRRDDHRYHHREGSDNNNRDLDEEDEEFSSHPPAPMLWHQEEIAVTSNDNSKNRDNFKQSRDFDDEDDDDRYRGRDRRDYNSRGGVGGGGANRRPPSLPHDRREKDHDEFHDHNEDHDDRRHSKERASHNHRDDDYNRRSSGHHRHSGVADLVTRDRPDSMSKKPNNQQQQVPLPPSQQQQQQQQQFLAPRVRGVPVSAAAAATGMKQPKLIFEDDDGESAIFINTYRDEFAGLFPPSSSAANNILPSITENRVDNSVDELSNGAEFGSDVVRISRKDIHLIKEHHHHHHPGTGGVGGRGTPVLLNDSRVSPTPPQNLSRDSPSPVILSSLFTNISPEARDKKNDGGNKYGLEVAKQPGWEVKLKSDVQQQQQQQQQQKQKQREEEVYPASGNVPAKKPGDSFNSNNNNNRIGDQRYDSDGNDGQRNSRMDRSRERRDRSRSRERDSRNSRNSDNRHLTDEEDDRNYDDRRGRNSSGYDGRDSYNNNNNNNSRNSNNSSSNLDNSKNRYPRQDDNNNNNVRRQSRGKDTINTSGSSLAVPGGFGPSTSTSLLSNAHIVPEHEEFVGGDFDSSSLPRSPQLLPPHGDSDFNDSDRRGNNNNNRVDSHLASISSSAQQWLAMKQPAGTGGPGSKNGSLKSGSKRLGGGGGGGGSVASDGSRRSRPGRRGDDSVSFLSSEDESRPSTPRQWQQQQQLQQQQQPTKSPGSASQGSEWGGGNAKKPTNNIPKQQQQHHHQQPQKKSSSSPRSIDKDEDRDQQHHDYYDDDDGNVDDIDDHSSQWSFNSEIDEVRIFYMPDTLRRKSPPRPASVPMLRLMRMPRPRVKKPSHSSSANK